MGIDTVDCQWPLQLEAWCCVLSAATSHGGRVHQGARHCPLLRVRATVIQVCVNIGCSVEGKSVNMVEFIVRLPARCFVISRICHQSCIALASVCYCNLSSRCAVLAVKVAWQCVQATVAGPSCVRGAVRLALLSLPLLPSWLTEKVC